MSERLSVTAFGPAVGTPFAVTTDAGVVELHLRGAGARDGAPAGPDGWVPFNLLFVGPADHVLPQRSYRFEHPVVGVHEIFIVPIGRDPEGTHYEAVFG